MTTYLVLEHAYSYGYSLCTARRLTDAEKTHKLPEYWDLCFVDLGGSIDLRHIRGDDPLVYSIITRPYDGSFDGCSNQAYIITQEEWDQLIELDKAKGAEKARKKREESRELWTSILHDCERQSHLYTREEAAAARKRWRDTQNEGGEGYMPRYRTIDDYEQAKARLAELDKEEMEGLS